MDDAATFTSDTASMKRRILLEQLMTIRSLMRKEGAADDDDSRDRDVINYMKKGMTLNKEQLTTALSTEFLLTVLLDVMLLRLMDEGEEGGATSPVSSDRQQAAAAKKKQKAAAKKKRYKRNKAAAKHKKINLMSWLSGGIISVIMMVAFSFITTPIVTLSLFQPSDGSGDGKVPPALPPSASKSLRQDDMKLKNEASTLPDIIVSPLAAVVPPPIFAQTAVSNRRRMKSDEMRESTSTASAIDTDHPTSHNHNSNLPTYSPFTPYPAYSPINLNPSTTPCLDTPNWKDGRGNGCDWYREYQYRCVFSADNAAGYMGSAKNYCCICGGGSHSLPPTNSPTITSSPTKSTNPSSSPSSKPSSSPTKSANPSSYPSSKPSSSPTQFCMDTPNWEDKYGWGCDDYRGSQHRCSYLPVAGDMGSASTHCCICDGGINSFPPSTSLKPSSSPTKSANPSSSPSSKPSSSPTQFCMDTPNWESVYGEGCDFYQNRFEPGCPVFGNKTLGEIGSANEHCCHCGGGSRTCQDFRSKCQDYFNVVGIKDGALSPLCKEAESCSCEATDHAVKIDTYFFFSLTVGLYNECKCNFWTPLCEDKGVGEACDYAAEYCCGDYMYDEFGGFQYLNSPTCYCDFFTYAQDEFGHKLEPKALNISEEFDNACSQIHSIAEAEMKSEEGIDFIRLFEKPILETIYIETNGENWTNSAGWMNETVDHCQWYGITCDSDSSVTSIDLRDNNLSGQFPIFTRNEFLGEFFPESDWIPDFYNLKTLDLADNKLTGTINYLPLYNLYSLTHFDVSGNQLSGEVDALVTPSLTYADFSSNRFSSMRRFEKYKVLTSLMGARPVG